MKSELEKRIEKLEGFHRGQKVALFICGFVVGVAVSNISFYLITS